MHGKGVCHGKEHDGEDQTDGADGCVLREERDEHLEGG